MTIKEVSEKVNISSDTLRYYERVGLIGPITKTKSGIRNYQELDLKRISFIKCMRSAEIPIEVLKKYVDLYEKGNSTIKERKELLENQRETLKQRINEMNIALDKLDYKIELYKNGSLDQYME